MENRHDHLLLGARVPAEPFPGVPASAKASLDLTVIWRKKFWVLGAMLLGGVAGCAWVIFQPPMYLSRTTIELVGLNESFMGMNQLDPQAGTGSYSATSSNIQTQTRVLMSRSLLGRVAERVNLEVTPIGTTGSPGIFSKLRSRLGVLPQEPVEAMKEAVQVAVESTRARGVGVSRLIEITSESTSPEVAAAFANTLASEYISQSSQFRTSTALRTMQWMEGQLEETKNRLERAEAKLQEYVQKSGNMFVLDQSTLTDSKLRQLQAELSTIQADRITKESRWEIAKASPVDAVPEILDDGRMRELRTRITDLRRERAQLEATLTPEHYKVKRIDAQIVELEQTLQKERANLVKRIQNEYEAALKREKLLSEAYTAQSRTLSGQAGKAAEYAMLRRDVELTRQAYNSLLQQTNQASVVTAVPANNARIVDGAVAASEPASPSPLRDIPTGMLLGGGLVAGILLWRGKVRGRRRELVFAVPGLSGSALNVPELGVIPSLAPQITNGLAKPKLLSFLRRTPESDLPRRELAAWHQRPSFLAESFRYVLVSILNGENAPARSIVVVTSPGPGEGKTTLVSNLAIAVAETGRRVLLIDGDLRGARLHRAFDRPEAPGFKELLVSGEAIESVDLTPYLRETGIPGLTLLPAGQCKDDESVGQLLFSDRILGLFVRLRREYDIVLVDTAPMLHFPHARLLGRLTDGVILVVRSGVTSRESALAAAQRFHTDRIPVLGTILNDWDPAEGGEKHGSYYNRYYSSTKE